MSDNIRFIQGQFRRDFFEERTKMFFYLSFRLGMKVKLYCPILVLLCFALTLAIPGNGAAQGISQRYAHSTINLPQSPKWPGGYQLANAFGTNTFWQPLCIASPPGESNRVFVLDKIGLVEVVSNLDSNRPTRSTYLDLQAGLSSIGEQGLLGIAFHPNFQSNGFFFIYRSVDQGNGTITERLSRFRADPPSNPTASAATEVILFDQIDRSSTHNGGDLHFGADGYLYVSVGDGGASLQGVNDQTIRKGLHSGLLRIDVDLRPENLPPNPPSSTSELTISTNYLVPNDNPFFTQTFSYEKYPSLPTNSIRTEFWAVGLRNPWRFSIDPETDWIWLADVGNFAYEEVNLIIRGGNYGWSYREGTGVQGDTFIDPIFEYPHRPIPNAIVGGLVYHGSRLPQLDGFYVFGDWGTGELWKLRYDGNVVTEVQSLPIKEQGIAAFGTDPRNGDLLVADIDSGIVRRLTYSESPPGPLVPATLAETGIFANTANRTLQSGFVTYQVKVPSWADNGVFQRSFSVPDTNLTIGWNSTGNWSFPTGTVWVQHIELRTNSPGPRVLVETRVLVRTRDGAYGASYRWGGQTNATLVGEAGDNELFAVTDSSGNVVRNINWIYPGRSDCMRCHNAAGGFALGFNTAQLNLSRFYAFPDFPGATGTTANQLSSLAAVGYFGNVVPDPATLPALALWSDQSATLEWRVRSYLAANCVQCHQPDVVESGNWDARYHISLPQSSIIWGWPNQNFGNSNAHVITPHSLTNSMIFQRLGAFVGTRMPPLGSTLVDTNNLNLMAQWIATLSDLQPPYLRMTSGPHEGEVSLRWPADPDFFDLFATTNLALPISWSRETTSIVISNGQRIVTVPFNSEPKKFYQLESR